MDGTRHAGLPGTKDMEGLTTLQKHGVERMRERSGEVTISSPLVCFLYLLLRQGMPAGAVEELVMEAEVAGNAEVDYTNGWLAKYADDLAKRLAPKRGR